MEIKMPLLILLSYYHLNQRAAWGLVNFGTEVVPKTLPGKDTKLFMYFFKNVTKPKLLEYVGIQFAGVETLT